MAEENGFDQWCIVELFGRQVIAGKVTEQVIGGGALLRVDVPEVDTPTGRQPGFTRFYGQGAIYAITPVSEEVARVALRRFRPAPVNVYVPELLQLAARSSDDGEDPEDEEHPDDCECQDCRDRYDRDDEEESVQVSDGEPPF